MLHSVHSYFLSQTLPSPPFPASKATIFAENLPLANFTWYYMFRIPFIADRLVHKGGISFSTCEGCLFKEPGLRVGQMATKKPWWTTYMDPATEGAAVFYD